MHDFLTELLIHNPGRLLAAVVNYCVIHALYKTIMWGIKESEQHFIVHEHLKKHKAGQGHTIQNPFVCADERCAQL